MDRPEPLVLPDGRTVHPPRYNEDGFVYKRRGLRSMPWVDSYHYMLRAPWSVVLAMGFGVYTLLNLGFAAVYAALPGGIAGASHPIDYLAFSVQTFATIGYGALTPATHAADLVVLVESFVGLAFTALGAGLMFAKFSRPTARVVFSDVMVVHERDGVPCLLFRVANQRKNQVVEARLHVSIVQDEITAEGDHLRRFKKLELERSFSPMFVLGWTAIHRIEGDSPLLDVLSGRVHLGGVVVIFTGTDDTFSQQVNARRYYGPEQLHIGYRFADTITHHEWGIEIDHTKFNEIEPE